MSLKDQDETKDEKGKLRDSIIIVLITGGFSILAALASNFGAYRSAQEKGQIEAITNRAETTLAELKQVNYELPVGTVVASLLDPEKFYKLTDGISSYDQETSNWCLADGESIIVGTAYHRITGKDTIDNFRDYFLRGKNQTRALGSLQADAFQGHAHESLGAKWYGTHWTTDYTEEKTPQVGANVSIGHDPIISTKKPVSDGENGIPRISNETRPMNVAVNYYVKVN